MEGTRRRVAIAAAGLGSMALLGSGVAVAIRSASSSPPPKHRDYSAVVKQSLRRLASPHSVTYDVSLRVDGLPDRPSAFTVHGAADQVTTMTTGTVQVAGTVSDEGHLRFFVAGRRLFLAHDVEGGPLNWQEVDLLDALRSQDDNDGRLLALAVQRPSALAALLLGVDHAERLGRGTLESGAVVTGYRAHVSFDAALGRVASAADGDLLRVVTDRLDGDQTDLDVWIDRNGTLRSLAFVGTIDGGTDYSLRLDFRTFEFAVFDHTVPSTLPTQTTVIDLDSLDDLIRLGQANAVTGSAPGA
jgi:hypothetical protein